MKILQVLPTVSFGDAVGNDAIALKNLLQEKDFETQIFAESIDSRLPKDTAVKISKIPELSYEDIVIYHKSVASALSSWIKKQVCRKVMIYHNITPPEYFAEYNTDMENLCRNGYDQLQKLTESFDMILSVSAYNRQNLLDMGFKVSNYVLPILIPFDDYKKKASAKIVSKYTGDGYTNIVFVGRIAPNKCQQDVIRAFSGYQRFFNAKSRLFIVGNSGVLTNNYVLQLKKYAKKLGAKNVIFTGHCPFDEILAYYHLADIFLCQSEHEGFCVPLVEAMYFDVPIVAYDSSAIGETLGGSGFLLKDKNPLETAAVMNKILTDAVLRDTILENQRERLQDFGYDKVKALFWKYMNEFIGNAV